METVKIGIIGLGFMGSTHFRIYEEMKNAKVIAIADIDDVKRTGDISKVVGNIGNYDNSQPLNLSGIKTYKSAKDLIANPEIDVVDICVPTPWHAEYIIAALKAGKHVFSEKPLCRNMEEALRISEAVKESKTFLNIGMCVRAWPEYAKTYEDLKKGKFGKLYSATFRRLSPSVDGNSWNNWFMDGKMSGGALLDLHLHDTDIITHFFGRPVGVTSSGINIKSQNNGIDHIITVYHYDNNTLVEAEGSWSAPKATPFEMTFQIICEKATIRLMAEGFKYYWNNGKVETPSVKATTGWHVELDYFIDCIANGNKPVKYQTFDSILDGFKVVMAEKKSIELGKRVNINY